MQNFLVIPVGLLILLQATLGSPTPVPAPARHPKPFEPEPPRDEPRCEYCSKRFCC
ncbi:hypothetical protein PTTG_26417 [Puccinia triticina 1-1 BBBD Race 1]|uniref:Uncharacterized protein n=2 Tax=Puccinia triticina TaxID=208348 RepID=A0A180GTS4_PUCT1|nr:hypothetical protein PTTG_26417 [Puccinia triticina 1-1 BBBD Race 1]